MKNATKHTTEFRMDIAEAKQLLEEIVTLEKKLEEKTKVTIVEKTNEVIAQPPLRVIDGGFF